MKRISDISALLSKRAHSIAQMLLPGGKLDKGMWICGDVSGQPGKSLQVTLDGEHAGQWCDWSCPDQFRGDLLDLWRETRGITPREAIDQAKRFLGIQEAAPIAPKVYQRATTNHTDLSPEGKLYGYFLNERKITPEIVNRFRIQGCSRKFREFEANEPSIVFPCFGPNGERLNNSYCALKRAENGRKAVSQDTGAAPCLFGWQAMSDAAYKNRAVILCEGQIDCMTWTQWGFACLSVPAGSGTTWLDFEYDNLAIFQTIYLSYDMDGKTSESLQKVISRLGKHRVMVVSLPHKDANDCLKAGCTSDDAKRWLTEAQPPKVKDFISSGDLTQRVLNEFFNPQTGLRVELFEGKNDDSTFFLRPAEVTAWTGIAGHGKTAFLTMLFLRLAGNDVPCFIASFEMRPERIIRNMIRCESGVICPPEGLIKDFMHVLAPNLTFFDRIGSASQDELLEMMEFAYCRHGAQHFAIDSFMCVDDLEEDYPAQGKFLDRLVAFSDATGAHVHLIVHPRKTADDSRPTGNDIKGASLIRNKVHNIISVARNIKKERELLEGEISQEEADKLWDAQLCVEKDREQGQVKHFRYKYRWKVNQFIPMK